MALSFKARAPRWAAQPSTFFLLLNACLLTALVHYWSAGFQTPAAVNTIWIGTHEPPHEHNLHNSEHVHVHNAVVSPSTPPAPPIQSWIDCGPDDEICATYGKDVVARSRAYEGSNARLRRVLRDARAGKPIKIGVLGGSVTKGQGVKRHEIWTSVFADWWKTEFPGRLTLQNGAVAATGTGYMSMCYREHIDDDADIIITEFAVNDQRTEANAESFEWLVRQLLLLPKQPAVVNLQTFGLGYAQLTTGGDLHSAVANYYDTPIISLRNALLPQLLEARSAAPAYFARLHGGKPDFKHINNHGHKMLADLLIGYTERQLRAFEHSPTSPLSTHSDAQLHVDPEGVPALRLFQNFNDPSPPVLDPFCASTRAKRNPLIPAYNDGRWSNWTFAAQGGSAKAYVVAHEPGARIGFKVPVRGGLGRVRVSFLQSSTFGLGMAKCWLDDDTTAAALVDGYWDSPLNLANMAVVSKTASVGEHMLWCELTGHTRDPEGRTEFRLIGVDAA